MTHPTDKESVAALDDLTAGNAFRDTLLKRADAWQGMAPLWHGWAIMDAFLAGAKYARALSPAQGDGCQTCKGTKTVWDGEFHIQCPACAPKGDGMRELLKESRDFLQEQIELGELVDGSGVYELTEKLNAALASHPDRAVIGHIDNHKTNLTAASFSRALNSVPQPSMTDDPIIDEYLKELAWFRVRVEPEPEQKPERRLQREAHKPSGSTPVPGGGARERARRRMKMICETCGDHIGHCECHVTPG